MYTQDRLSKIKRKKSKKGVSEIIGYVLLVSFAIILSIIVYKWMKTYVPQEEINCPSGVSLFIDSYSINGDILTITIRNNGKFNVGGYFIYATDSPAKELATIDLSGMNVDNTSILKPLGIKFGAYITQDPNSLAPNDVETDAYNISSIPGGIYSIDIFPIRWQTKDRKSTVVSCKDSKIREQMSGSGGGSGGTCNPNCPGGAQCGSDGCGGSCGSCLAPTPICSNYQCTALSCTPNCTGKVCGSDGCSGTCGTCSNTHGTTSCSSGLCQPVCSYGFSNCDSNNVTGCETTLGTFDHCANCTNVCLSGQTCNAGVCTGTPTNTCNGTWNPPEGVVCDGGTLCFSNCTCQRNYEGDGSGGCGVPGGIQSCANYCSFLEYSGSPVGSCRSSPGNCASSGGTYQSGGDVWCTGGSNADRCCCYN